MLTFFTTAKPFREHHGIIQRNALNSWTQLHPDVEVILFGDEEGAVETASEFGLRHEAHVERNEFGTKRLDFMFWRAQTIACHDLLCYINCDILLMQDFGDAVKRVQEKHAQFLMVGRRWDAQIILPLSFGNKDWESLLRQRALRNGRKRGPEWIDYFVFSRGIYGEDVPPFVVGRAFWDNWLVWKALAEGHSVIDVSASVLAVHQNHDYGYHPQGKEGVFSGAEAARNYALAGGWRHLRTIADATELLSKDGLKTNRSRHWASAKRYTRQAGRVLLHSGIERAWFFLLGLTRPVRRKFGWNAENVRRFLSRTASASGKHL
ncbi:MAG TPA: hypothetical protein VJN89_15900 [Candidatus Acidoferrum sp.]|nr:hypothetical protein [Candidatus Acidoferrum sp.]